jgi:hypothetical protein
METYILHLTQFLNFYIEWITFFVKSKYNAKTILYTCISMFIKIMCTTNTPKTFNYYDKL